MLGKSDPHGGSSGRSEREGAWVIKVGNSRQWHTGEEGSHPRQCPTSSYPIWTSWGGTPPGKHQQLSSLAGGSGADPYIGYQL